MELFESLGVDLKLSYLSTSVSLDNGYEWGTQNGLSSLFAYKKNMFNPYFLQMIREVHKFKENVLR
jgi:cyclopropane-fatty-acyl-phospholipid synthase